jgi:signal transduction histidine kinase
MIHTHRTAAGWPGWPPARFAAPLLVLVFGMTAVWFDYWLALDVNLARNLAETRYRAEMVTERLAVTSEALLSRGQMDVVRLNLETLFDVPDLVIAAVVDDRGIILADSSGTLQGRPANKTPLAAAAGLIRPVRKAMVESGENEVLVFAAYPFSMPLGGVGWALIELNRGSAVGLATQEARVELSWITSAMLLLSFALWAVLHYGYASRLGTLAEYLQKWQAGDRPPASLPQGGDEVGNLAESFDMMMRKLGSHEVERLRLEREVLNISEGERQRIGHDLHDGLGQRLTASSMAVQAMLEELKENAPTLAAHGELVSQQLREAIAETRALSHGLAPVSMQADGLVNALTEMTASVNSSGKVRCVLDCSHPVNVRDVEVGVQLFRIAQEAVNNALKHASATEIRVGLEQVEDSLVLEVEDDGCGLDESKPAEQGLGLRIMQYRARLIEARLAVTAAVAGGTCVRCAVKSSPTA